MAKLPNINQLIAKDAAENKSRGTSGKTRSSGTARAILAKLRENGQNLVGLTVGEIRHKLQLSQSDQQTRKAIRMAQVGAVEA